MKKVLVAAIGLVVVLAVAEIGLRLFFGLGSPPLVYASPKFGYAFRPNQSLKRFGHPISYNESDLRSEPLRPASGSAYRVLCVGGSVTNGGALIDQQETYPYLLESILKSKGQDDQVLNASAVGWDFSNELGFLQDKGLFSAKVVALEVGTRQLYQLSSSTSIVGVDANLPDHNPTLALGEVFERYLLPRVSRRMGWASEVSLGWTDDALTEENYQRGVASLKRLVAFVAQSGARPILVMTPDKDEASPGHYRREHKDELNNIALGANGQLVDMLPPWHSEIAQGHDIFRDLTDPNATGNRLMAQAVAAAILQ